MTDPDQPAPGVPSATTEYVPEKIPEAVYAVSYRSGHPDVIFKRDDG